MKTIQTYIVAGVMSFMISVPGFTQDLNTDRMNRDIRIMENVIGELLKTSRAGSNSVTGSSSGSGYANTIVGLPGSGSNVKGTYLPGYGVIFSYEPSSSFYFRTRNSSENNEEETTSIFSYNTTGTSGNSEVDKESIKQRMKEFLKDYAPTIGQLKDDENVLLIYKSGSANNRLFPRIVFNGQVTDEPEIEKIPTISMGARKSDLNAFKQGKLNENSLNERITVSESVSKEILDLKIFSNILETGLSGTEGESFKVRGKVSYLLLDNFGALFNMDVRHDLRMNVFFEVRDDKVREMLAETAVEGLRLESSEEAEKSREERIAKVNSALQQLLTDLKIYIADYGTTLSSVKSDQNVLVTVNLGQGYMMNNDIFPDRVSLQINKSVLDQLSKGSISREQAMDRISVIQY